MILHYLKIGGRNLLKYKFQSVISMVGLAIGITFFTIGYYWYVYETSFDSFYPEADRTYAVYTIDKQTNKRLPGAPSILGAVLNEDFPEVKYATLLINSNYQYTCDGKKIGRPDIIGVTPAFTTIFPPKVLAGDPDNPLPPATNGASFSLMVTKEFALKHWKTVEEAIGKVLIDQYNNSAAITAVIQNPPLNSTFRKEGYYAIPMNKSIFTGRSQEAYWNFPPFEMYLCLREKVDVDVFEKRLKTYAIDHQYNPNLYIGIVPKQEARYTLGTEMSFNINYIRMFVISGMLLLLCSLFNFVTLQVNRMFERTREFTLRSSLGGMKRNLFMQMAVEVSIQLVGVLLICFSLLELFVPVMEFMLDTVINKAVLYKNMLFIGCLGWGTIVSIIFILTSRFIYKLTKSVKEESYSYSGGRNWVRMSTIGLQLAISSGFMFLALVLFLQTNRMRQTSFGFNKENLVQVKVPGDISFRLTEEIKKIPAVTKCIRGGSFRIEHDRYRTEKEIGWENKPIDKKYEIQLLQVGIEFAEEMHIPLVKGRYLSDSDINGEDVSGIPCRKVLINEEMEKLMGLGDAVGKMISRKDYILRGEDKQPFIYYEIVGVVKNFQGRSLRHSVTPTLIEYWNFQDEYLYLRTLPGKESKVIEKVRTLIDDMNPDGIEIEVTDVITVNDWLYILSSTERASFRLFALLAALCVLISLFGVYSVSSSHIQQRKKEIAIRKVVGATFADIVCLFIWKYATIAFTANLVALPIAYLFAMNWLEQYPDHIMLGWPIFIVILVAVVVLVSVTILNQVVRAANGAPAEVVKSDS